MKRLFFGLTSFLLASCSPSLPSISPKQDIQKPTHFDHQLFSKILQQVVQKNGFVDYAALKQHPAELDAYLTQLAETEPSAMAESEKIAFWCNVYNAYTLKLIAANYPTRSILRLTPLFIPKYNTPFLLKFVIVGGKTYSLDEVEHQILRKDFQEPRIHAAINCASVSCPNLRNEAFEGSKLETQLEAQMRAFLFDTTKNEFDNDDQTLHLSKIFDWFGSDFVQKSGSLQKYLAQYATGDMKTKLEQEKFKIRFKNYNWGLNDSEK